MTQRLRRTLGFILSLVIILSIMPSGIYTFADPPLRSTESNIFKKDGVFYKSIKTPYITQKQRELLQTQIKWIDFSDSSYVTIDATTQSHKSGDDFILHEAGETINGVSQAKGSNFKVYPMLNPDGSKNENYYIEFEVEHLKPFNATDIYKERTNGNASLGYDANRKNSRTGYPNSLRDLILRNVDTGWANAYKSEFGILETDHRAFFSASNGGNVGVQFKVTGKLKSGGNWIDVKPNIVVMDGEEAGNQEVITMVTDGEPWELLANVNNVGLGGTLRDTPITVYDENNFAGNNEVKSNMKSYWVNPDGVNGGIGTQVFGPVSSKIANENGVSVILTRASQHVSVYICSDGAQSLLIGVMQVDEGDAPDSYGHASHSVLVGGNVKHPYLGTEPADYQVHNDSTKTFEGSHPWTWDDKLTAGAQVLSSDEGEAQLTANNDGKYEVRNSALKHMMKVKANSNDAGNVAYVRAFVDFNNNNEFDVEEYSKVVTVPAGTNLQDVDIEFENAHQLKYDSATPANNPEKLGARVRISRIQEDVLSPVGVAYSGEVEDFQINNSYSPIGSKKTSIGYLGKTQNSDVIDFTAYGKELGTNNDNAIDNSSIKIVNPENGNLVNSYFRAGEGTYTVNADGSITFEPEPNFVGIAEGIVIRATDKNSNTTGWQSNIPNLDNINDGSINSDHKATMDAVYIPTVTATKPIGVVDVSQDVQGEKQSGTVEFASGDKIVKLKDITYKSGNDTGLTTGDVDISASRITDNYGANAEYINAYQKGTNTVIGQYIITGVDVTNNNAGADAIAKKTVNIDFVPNKDFSGEVAPLEMTITDNNDAESNVATYIPTVSPVTPTGETKLSQGHKDEEKTVTLKFYEGDSKVAIDTNVGYVLDGDTDNDNAIEVKFENENKIAGKYELNSATGEVTFIPDPNLTATDKGQVKKATVIAKDINGTDVESYHVHTIIATDILVDNEVSSGYQGLEQEATKMPKFTEKNNGSEHLLGTNEEFKVAGSDGTAATVDGDKYTVTDADQGVYEVTVEDGKVTAITFTPNKDFIGVADGIKITLTKNGIDIVSSTYIPTVIPVTPIANNMKSIDVQGKTQEVDLFPSGDEDKYFESGHSDIDLDKSTLQFDNGNTTKTVPNEGTYTITNGMLKFEPVDGYTGTPTPQKVIIEDENGTSAEAIYQPVVVPLMPIAERVETEDVQGEEQFAKVEDLFKDASVDVDGTEVSTDVSLVKNTLTLVDANGNEKTQITILDEGTYSIVEKNGKKLVKFVPEPEYVGEAKLVKVQITYAGTKINAVYQPTVKPVSISGNRTDTSAKKNQVQEATPEFTYDDGKNKNEIATGEVKLLSPDGTRVDKLVVFDKNDPSKFAGTYEVNNSGKITFTPAEDYVGTPTPVTAEIIDSKYGAKGTAIYKPKVTNAGSSSSHSSHSGGSSSSDDDDEDAVVAGGASGSLDDDTYDVETEYVSADGKKLPKEIKDIPTEKIKELKDGEVVELSQPETTVVEVEDGKWIFRGFDKTSIKVDGKDIKVLGKWLFLPKGTPTYEVKTEFVSSTPDKELPPEVKELASEMVVNLINGDKVDAVYPEKLEIKVDGGKWVFKSFDKSSHTILNANGTITGVWEFIEDEDAPQAGMTQEKARTLPDTGDGLSPKHYFMIGLVLSLMMFVVGFRFRAYEKKKHRRH